MTARLYLDQNYLSGIAKGKPAFAGLEAAVREAIGRRAVRVLESDVHARESAPRPDLGLMELLRSLSGGRRLPPADRRTREVRRRMEWVLDHELPERRSLASDAGDLEALALAVVHCDLVTCDAFMADVLRRARLELRHGCELFTGRRPDVRRLGERLEALH